MFMTQSRLYIVDSSIRHAALIKYLKPLSCSACPCLAFDQCFELNAVLHSYAVRGVSLIGFPFGLAELIAEHAEQPIVAASEQDITVASLEAFVWDN